MAQAAETTRLQLAQLRRELIELESGVRSAARAAELARVSFEGALAVQWEPFSATLYQGALGTAYLALADLIDELALAAEEFAKAGRNVEREIEASV